MQPLLESGPAPAPGHRIIDPALRRIPGPCGICGGIADDYRRRFPQYWKDIRAGFHLKTLSSALFMFFATFTSTVALGVKISSDLDNRIGVSEYLLMNSIAGMAHALFGCQPLLVLRPTGPITLIITLLSGLADNVFHVDFWQLLAWTGFFVSFLMLMIAALELSRWIGYLTRFTHDIFAFFVCSIYIYDGVSSIIKRFTSGVDTDDDFARALFSTLIAVGTFAIALFLHGARGWKCLQRHIRNFLADYAVTIAVATMSATSFAFPQLKGLVTYISAISLAPSCHRHNNTEACERTPHNSSSTFAGDPRPWATTLWDEDTPWYLPLCAAACAVLIVFFFFMDQNISSVQCQLPSKKLPRGSYYHSSFMMMGIFNAIGPAFGLPFVTGSLPHSPQFVNAVTDYRKVGAPPAKCCSESPTQDEDGKELDTTGADAAVWEVSRVHENRLAPFIMYLLIGLTLFVPQFIELMPYGTVDGTLTFVGVAGLFQCQLWTRILFLFRAPSEYPSLKEAPFRRGVSTCQMHLYTLIQLLCLAVCWAVNLSPVGLAFSLIVVSLVPFRKFIVSKCFKPEVLASLDADEHDE